MATSRQLAGRRRTQLPTSISAMKKPAKPARLPPQPRPTISSSTVRTGSSARSQFIRLSSKRILQSRRRANQATALSTNLRAVAEPSDR